MASLPTPLPSVERYLELDRGAERPSEYYDGEVFPVETATVAHGRIHINLTVGFEKRLGEPSKCQLVGPTVRVQIPRSAKYTYPDLIIACGKLELEDKNRDTLINPVVLFEILSPSTAGFDRDEKFRMYRSIPSLQEYVLVSQERVLIERYQRQTGPHWLYEDLNSLESDLVLDSVGCSIPLAEIYAKIEFDPGVEV